MPRTFTTKTARETEELAEKLLPLLLKHKVILLEGSLGSGKTTFVKGLAKALGIRKVIKSPTYIYVNNYEFRISNFDINSKLKIDSKFKTCPSLHGGQASRRVQNSKFTKLCHFDLYRLPETSENPSHTAASIGLTDALDDPHALVVIEWPERLPIKKEALKIQFVNHTDHHKIIIH